MPEGPRIRIAANIHLTPEIEAVLRSMFDDCGQVAVEAEYGRGFSGSRAFKVRLVDTDGRARLPAVIKVALDGLIRSEWQAYEKWVKNTLPNIARLEALPTFPAGNSWGGLRYALVGGGTFEVQSLYAYYQKADIDDICWILEQRLFRIMSRRWWFDNRADHAFQMQSDYDPILPVNLIVRCTPVPNGGETHNIEANSQPPMCPVAIGDCVRLKGFVVAEVDPVRAQLTLNVPPMPDGATSISYRVRLIEVPDLAVYQAGDVLDEIGGDVVTTRHDLLVGRASRSLWQTVDFSNERLALSGQKSLPNPLLTYRALLQDILTVNISTIHGDLNLENILIDPATREVSLIDFATVREGHALHDLLRLETGVLITLVPQALQEAGLPPETIYPFYEQLEEVTVRQGNQLVMPDLPGDTLVKPFKVLQVIRKIARNCLFDADDWDEYYRGLLLYLLGALKFNDLYDPPLAPLPSQVAVWGAAAVQQLLEEPQTDQGRRAKNGPDAFNVLSADLALDIEPPFGTMPADSRFYIERAADDECWRHIASPYAVTLFVQAPMQTGKSSLIRRMLHRAETRLHIQSAYIDFQGFTEQYLADEESFFIGLCLMIGDALGVSEAVDSYWEGRRTNIMKCSRYLSEHIMPTIKRSFILAMDEVERMLDCPFRANFFGMLRTWHNNRVDDDGFGQMTLFLSSSTDSYLLIDKPHQSPFNVATPIRLQDFTIDEVHELNSRHNSPLDRAQVQELVDLLNGHPFLTRLALYQVALHRIDLRTLLARAAEPGGPFGDHLRHYWRQVEQQPELRQALTQICNTHTHSENPVLHRLVAAGLVTKVGDQVSWRNRLYDRYFKERLNG